MSTVTALVIDPSNRCRLVQLPNGDGSTTDQGSLTARQKLVNGYLEPVQVESDWHVWINEDGKYKFQLPDAYNAIVTDLLWKHSWPRVDWIAGPAIIVGTAGPADTDVPHRIIQKVWSWYGANFEEGETV